MMHWCHRCRVSVTSVLIPIGASRINAEQPRRIEPQYAPPIVVADAGGNHAGDLLGGGEEGGVGAEQELSAADVGDHFLDQPALAARVGGVDVKVVVVAGTV